MIKSLTGILTCFLFLYLNNAYAQNLEEAGKFITILSKQSHINHGIPLNSYIITDLNLDGLYEVIEITNEIENESPGFLNVELVEAFNNESVFSFKNGEFKECYEGFDEYLMRRLSHYEFWKELILNPSALSQDSKNIIKANSTYFQEKIDHLIQLTQSRIAN